MATRQTLGQHPEIDPDDVDDVIGIAAELAAAEADRRQDASLAEVEAVARELDIPDHLVAPAVEELRRRRHAAEVEASEAAAAAEARRARWIQVAVGLALVVAVVGGLRVLAGMASTSYDAGQMEQAAAEVRAAAATADGAEEALATVLDRQAALAPQLLGLAGGDPGALQGALADYRAATTIDARLEAADALGVAMGQALGALPPAGDPAAARQRDELLYELSGTVNRVSTEGARYRQALVRWRAVAAEPEAAEAIAEGLAPAPPP